MQILHICQELDALGDGFQVMTGGADPRASSEEGYAEGLIRSPSVCDPSRSRCILHQLLMTTMHLSDPLTRHPGHQ